ncbi:MAG: hypothetical protein RL490_2696 [Pseudomonadota bacterium]
MSKFPMRATLAALALAVAAPALAQSAPPAPPPGAQPMVQKRMMLLRRGPGGGAGMMERGPTFATMSDAGQAIMRDALRAAADRKAEHDAVKAARDKLLAVLEADKLDNAALKRAADEERAAANAGRERAQATMIDAFNKLTVADRKAFVNETRVMKARMEQRLKQWRDRRGPGGPGGMGGPMGGPGDHMSMMLESDMPPIGG